MPYITNPNPGPQASWASNDPLETCLTNSAAWANELKAKINDLAASIEAPDFTVSWGDITGGIPLSWGAPYDKPERTTVVTIPMTVDAPDGPSTPLALGAIPDVMSPGVGTAPLWDVVLPPDPGAFTMPAGSTVSFTSTVLDAYAPTIPDAPPTTVAAMTTAIIPTAPPLVSTPDVPDIAPFFAESFGDVTLPTINAPIPAAPDVAANPLDRPTIDPVEIIARPTTAVPAVPPTTAPALIDPVVSALSVEALPAPPTAVTALAAVVVEPAIVSQRTVSPVPVVLPTDAPELVDPSVSTLSLSPLPTPSTAVTALTSVNVEPAVVSQRLVSTTPVVSSVTAPALSDPTISTLTTTAPDAPSTAVFALSQTAITPVGYSVQTGPSPVAISPRSVSELSALALPAFTLTADVGALDELVDNFSFVPGTYTPTLKDNTASTLVSVLGGQPIIGATAFDDIFIDAADDISAAYQDEILLAGNTCGMLGELPSEALVVRLDSATRKQRQGVQKARLTSAIEQAKAWREDLWKGVEASQAFEQLWSGFFIADEGRQLQAVTALTEARVAVYNTKVARFNALLSNVQSHLGVAAEQRQRALLVIEDHKARLEHKEADLRETDRFLASYQAQWQGVQIEAAANAARADIQVRVSLAELEEKKARHTAEIEEVQQAISAYQAVTQGRQLEIAVAAENRNAEALKVDAYRARLAGLELERKAVDQQIAAFQADIQAAASEVSAAVSIVEAKTKASLAQLESNRAAHTAEIEEVQQAIAAYQATIQERQVDVAAAAENRNAEALKIDAYRARLAGLEIELKSVDQQIAAFQADVQAASSEVSAAVSIVDAKTKASLAQLEANRAAHTAEIEEVQQAIAAYQAEVQGRQVEIAATAENRNAEALKVDAYRARLAGLEIELKVVDQQIAAFEADVRAASAEVNAAVSIADTKTKASLAQLEVNRAAQAAEISRIQQEIAAYQAQVQAVSAHTAVAAEERAAQVLLIDAYRAKLAGAELSLKATERDIAFFQAQTQAYSAQAGAQTAAFNSEVNAATLDVEQRKAQHATALAEYTAAVQVYQTQVQALNSQTAVAAEQRERALVGLQDYRAQLENRKLELEDADIQLKSWLGQWDAYAKSSGAQTTAFAERVRGFMAETEGKKLELSASVETSKAALAKEMAAATSFSEIWKGVAAKAQAVLTQMQSLSVPVELQIKSEDARTRSEGMTLNAALENAKNEMTKGIETAKLRLSQLQFASTQSIETSKALASLMAHTMGAYLSAGSVHYSVSSSDSYSNSNSYTMTKDETTQ